MQTFVLLNTWNNSHDCFFHVVVDCGTPPAAPANGQRRILGTNYLSAVEYQCNTGYYYYYKWRSLKTLTCMANGQWSGSAPACNGKTLRI